MNWTHDDLGVDLAAHLRGMTDRRVWVDMQLGAAGSTRPDVYTIPCSFTRFTPLAYECKVSMSDFRADVTKGKYTDYLAYSSGVIFACPAGLLTKNDVPVGTGLMVRGEGGWKTLKAPTLAKCPELPRSFWLKLVMDGERRDHERIVHMEREAKRDLNEWHAFAKVREKFGEVVAAAVQGHLDKTTHRLDRLKHDVAMQIGTLEQDLLRIKERRAAELKSQERECSEMLRDLAKAVGMEPDPNNIVKMSNRLDALIALAQKDSTVKELHGIVAQMRWGMERFHELERAIQKTEIEVAA